MSYKLPIFKIIADSLANSWINKEKYLKAISVPTLILVILWALWATLIKQAEVYAVLIVWLLYGLCFSLFAVTCHRLILVNGSNKSKDFNIKLNIRVLKFLVWLLLIYAIVKMLEAIPLTILANMNGSTNPGDGEKTFYWVTLLLSIPALYVLGRVSLIFPATAIDRNVSLKWSWKRTKNNGWRMFIIVGLFPWLLSIIIWFLWRENASTIESVILTIIGYFGLAIEIFALSLTYKAFEDHSELKEISP